MTPARDLSRIEALCEGIIEAGWLLALGLVPLLFNIYSSRTYEPDKAALLRSLAVVMVAAWLWKVVCGGRPSRPVPGADDIETDSERRSLRGTLRALVGVPLVPFVAALALALVVGSVLSVDSRLSWLGSYARAQGSWTQLTYLVVFALVLTHLRTGTQWRRVVFTVIVASASISLYGVFQELGIDPVTTSIRSSRVYSTLGNSIFLGAYLVMAVFVTALEFGRELVAWSQRWSRASRSRWWPGWRTLVVGAVLLCQFAALILSQSRGPFLGLLGGGYVFILVGLLRLRWSWGDSLWHQRWGSLIRWAVPGTVGAALLALVILVVANMPGSPLERIRNLPYVGRLGSVLDAESRTIQVRLYIWRSVSKMLQSEEPLESPGGTPDRLDGLRPFLGTGPETLGFAVNRFVEPRLGQLEALTNTPDRSHNEAFDLIVMHGALGALIWFGVFCTVCGLTLRRLGLMISRAETLGFWSVLGVGAALGAVTPWIASGETTLSGVGLSVGLISSLALFVTVHSLINSATREPADVSPATAWDGLLLALLATFVAHMVETQVGIAITTTRLYFWFYAAVAVLAARGWLAEEPPSPASSASSMSRGKGRKVKKRDPASPRGFVDSTLLEEALRGALARSLLAGSLCVPLIYGMTLSSQEARTLGAILANSWLGGNRIPTIAQLPAMSWLVLVTLLVAFVLTLTGGSGSTGGGRLKLWAAAGPALGVVAVAATVHAGRIAHAIERSGAPDESLMDAEFVADHFALLVGGLGLICLVIGAILGSKRGERLPWTRHGVLRAAVSGLLIAVAAVVVVKCYNVDPIRADSHLRVANYLIPKGRAEESLAILERAVALSPREPMYELVRGSAALNAAVSASEAASRTRFLDLSETSLRRAFELAPLDPDHSANLARCLARRASVEKDRRRKLDLLQTASEHYVAAVRLRPNSVVFLNESGRLQLNLGRYEDARRTLERAVELDASFTEPYIALGALSERSAATARSRGDAAGSRRLLEEAAGIYERVLGLQPDLEPAQRGRDRVRRAIALTDRLPLDRN